MSNPISIEFYPGELRFNLENARSIRVPFRDLADSQKDWIKQIRAIGNLAERYRYRLKLSQKECFSILHELAIIGDQLAALLFGHGSWPMIKGLLRDQPAVDIKISNFNYVWIPWEIFYIGDDLQNPEIQDFCGYKRTIFRVLDENQKTTVLTDPLKWGFLPFSGWSRNSIMSEVKDLEEVSCTLLGNKLIRKEFSPLNPQIERKLEIKRLRQYLENVNLIHFSCLINSVFENSFLLLDSSFWLSIEDLTKRVPDEIEFQFNEFPLIFFNVRDNYTRNPLHILSYIQTFHDLKALGVIASTLPMPNYLAAQFPERFYKTLLQDGQLIGRALAETKLYFIDQLNNPFALFYVPYLSPTSKMISSSHIVEAAAQRAPARNLRSSASPNQVRRNKPSMTGESKMELSHSDRQRLSEELQKWPTWLYGDKQGERSILIAAGLPSDWVMGFPLTGMSVIDTPIVISHLEKIEHLKARPKHHALGALVEHLLNNTPHLEGQLFLAHLIEHYQLITNLDYRKKLRQKYALLRRSESNSLLDLGWQGKEPDFMWQGPSQPHELEAIWQKKVPFLDAVFLEKGAKAARAVCRVEINGRAKGTGFLIAPHLVLTNHHVVPTDEQATKTQVRFGYRIDRSGQLQEGEIYQVKQALQRSPVKELDYVVLCLSDSPGAKDEIGVLSSVKASLRMSQPAFIIQHPQGEPQKVVLQENWVTYVATDLRRVQYLTNTMGGSSGSPVFNEKWEVVALHHSGEPVPALPKEMNIRGNEGIPMGAILPEIQDLLA